MINFNFNIDRKSIENFVIRRRRQRMICELGRVQVNREMELISRSQNTQRKFLCLNLFEGRMNEVIFHEIIEQLQHLMMTSLGNFIFIFRQSQSPSTIPYQCFVDFEKRISNNVNFLFVLNFTNKFYL